MAAEGKQLEMINGSSREEDIPHLKVRLKGKKNPRGRLPGRNDVLSVASLPASEGTTPPIYQLGGTPLADEPLQIRRGDAPIWHWL